jgi:anti-sigma B factor antagonist
MLNINRREDEDMVVLDLDGAFDLDSLGPVEQLMSDSSALAAAGVLWNFKEVHSINSSGIGILLDAFSRLKKRGNITKLVNVNDEVLDVLNVHKVLPAFDIHPCEMSAGKELKIELADTSNTAGYVRLYDRVNVKLSVKFKNFKKGRESETFPEHDAEVVSLSRGGVFLQTDDTYPKGSVLGMTLILGEEGAEIKMLGKVAWVADPEQHADRYPGMALTIVCMEKDDLGKLTEYLHTQGV